jgi:aflatoxin B1 aldehyde reductase
MINEKMKLVLGTMTFGPQVDENNSYEMINHFLDAGYNEIDTAFVYNEGQTELILGKKLKEISEKKYSLATKVNPRISGTLVGEAVNFQITESLKRLNRQSVDIFYFHFPDPITPIEDALSACAEHHKKGHFGELGLSNFPAWMVVDIWHKCKANGWPLPAVYQGMYNGLSRRVEKELIPAIRRLGMRFYAFNPLAGGLLSGKYKNYDDVPEDGRFSLRPNYKNRYWKKSFFDAIKLINEKCEAENITLPEAALRWLAFHSSLSYPDGDGIIIGASKINHLDSNMSAIEKGPLSESFADAFESAWLHVEADSPDYFQFYKKK